MFQLASRPRQYVIGVHGGVPLPLSVADVTSVLETHPSPLQREELDMFIFVLDAEFMGSLEEKPEPQQDFESAWRGMVAGMNVGRARLA